MWWDWGGEEVEVDVLKEVGVEMEEGFEGCGCGV